MFASLFNWLRGKADKEKTGSRQDRAILVFAHTGEVIRAEKLLKDAGWPIQVMGPPPGIQSGCDLVIVLPLIERLGILRQLEGAGLTPLEMVAVTDPLLCPVDIFQTLDFGDYLMVRAANMKLTVDKKTRTVVNVSGGGCPDVPFLAREMIGRTLDQAPPPRTIGHTLCGYALQLAYEEILRQCMPS